MKTKTSGTVLALFLAASIFLPNSSNAQTASSTTGTSNTVNNTSNSATMYTTSGSANTSAGFCAMPGVSSSQGGTIVNNPGSTPLSAGWYYTQTGNRIYYYGNGTYYDPSTQTYGGCITNSNGTAGIYNYGSTSGTGITPSVPNTGSGGDAPLNWFILLASGTIAVGGALYLTKQIAFS